MGTIVLSPKTGSRGAKEHALTYAALGWRVFPIYEIVEYTLDGGGVPTGWRCACADEERCGRPGKHPRTAAGVNEATTDRVTIEGWWTRWPKANVGIATGRASGITVVDADASNGKPGVTNLTAMAVSSGGMPPTPTVNTGGGGLHLYFLHTDKLPTGADVIAKAIDVRNDGGYVIAPPSRHMTGQLYTWRSDSGEPMTVPDWLLNHDKSALPQEKKGRKRVAPGYRVDRVESMLAAIDPDERDLWLKVGVIMGRLYIGTGVEHDAWAIYEAWSSRSAKFDQDKAGNLARMREMFYERSQEAPRPGAKELTIGTLIATAKDMGWSPFGNRKRISYEPGNEAEIADFLIEAVISADDNTFFNVMGEVRDVLKTETPIMRLKTDAAARGEKAPETLVVRRTSTHGLLCRMAERAVLETPDKHGAPTAVAIPEKVATMVLKQKAPKFPTLTGVAEWPMVAANGELIASEQGYDEHTGLYFDIDPGVKINEKLSSEEATSWFLEELFADFPFEDETDSAAALGLFLAFMQRPLMATCPGFAVVAPQPGTGKSTLIEVASLTIHGTPVAPHAYAEDEDELRKALHSLMLAKIPAIMFDNIGRGRTVDSDHLAKLLSSEMSADRTLGASETKKEVNTLLLSFTGNNIAFAHDMASRVMIIRLNAKTANPLARSFRHKNIKSWAKSVRNQALSACIAILRAGVKFKMPAGPGSRFEDFDDHIVKPVLAVTGQDIRKRLDTSAVSDSEEDADMKAVLELIWRWQMNWRHDKNKRWWRAAELVAAIDSKTFDDAGLKILQRGVRNNKLWELDLNGALGRMLRLLNGDHKYQPLLLGSQINTSSKVNEWFIKGELPKAEGASGPGF